MNSLPQDRREDLARRGALSAAMMHHVDEGIGKIIADLETNGELDNRPAMSRSLNHNQESMTSHWSLPEKSKAIRTRPPECSSVTAGLNMATASTLKRAI